MTKLPISVCMISGPEASRIGRALESVAGWTSEIIVVLNDDARDGTEEIALRYGASVFREAWKGHVKQKASAAQKAGQPWLLGLDADEAVSDRLRSEINGLFSNPARLEAHAAWQFPRLTWFCGRWIRHGDWYPDLQTRLWRKDAAEWGGADPHDKLHVRGTVGRLAGDLLHFSNPNISSYVQKINYFADAHLQRQLEQGARWSVSAAVARPAWRFLRAYFLRRGFLDGYPGFFIAASTAYSTLVRHSRLFEYLQRPDQEKCNPTKSP
jgi:glycosyltransferase involved in cell wall biosynthesis